MDLIDETSQSEARLIEDRVFSPSPQFHAQANVTEEIYGQADADPIAFWEDAAKRLDWATSPTTASTVTSTPVAATRSPCTSRASPATAPP